MKLKDSKQQDLDKIEHQDSSNSEEELDNYLPDPVQHDKPKCTKIIADVIHHQDFGYLKFDQASGKAIMSDALRTEIVERGSIYFQNSVGPFAQKHNRAMTSACLKSF